jgi:VIT1/CCC1 family predicted Fe2+/Mn2+ transporter/rubrerythrin
MVTGLSNVNLGALYARISLEDNTAIPEPPTHDDLIESLRENWNAEIHSARTYRELAAAEKDERRKGVLLRMAEAEERHAARWAKKLREHGIEPVATESWRERLDCWWNRHAGTEVAIRRLEAAEDRDNARYTAQQKHALGQDQEAQQILKEIAREEKAHGKALQSMVPALGPQSVLDTILKRERWHGRGGSWVADAIYGVNDGLGAVFGIVSGVAGATNNQEHFVLISGLAGMLASALSMGAGAYLAVKSEREEIEENPAEEREEMALFYQLQGFSQEESERMAERISQNPDQMVQMMAQQELGLSEHHFPNPWVSSFSAAASTAVGAFIPIVPFFFMGGVAAVIAAFVVSIVAHFVVGALKSLITSRSWWASGLEMTMVGVLEAAVTYTLGLAFGAM